MKTIKLNLLEKNEMNQVRGGGDAARKGGNDKGMGYPPGPFNPPFVFTCVCGWGQDVAADDFSWRNPSITVLNDPTAVLW